MTCQVKRPFIRSFPFIKKIAYDFNRANHYDYSILVLFDRECHVALDRNPGPGYDMIPQTVP